MNELSASIRRELKALNFSDQDKIPTERQLSKTLGVSRWHIRETLAELAREGVVWRHVGKGTFWGKKPPFEPEALRILADDARPIDILEARRAIEPFAASLAAARATEAQQATLQDAARRCETAGNMAAYEKWDEMLHRSIAEAANNVVISSVFEALNALRREVVWGPVKKAILKRERRALFVTEHKKIVDAITRRDSERAFQAMALHLEAAADDYIRITLAKIDGKTALRV